MVDFQRLLEQAAASGAPTPGVSESPVLNANPFMAQVNKQEEVRQATAMKKAELGGTQTTPASPMAGMPDFYKIAAGMGNDSGIQTADPFELDMRTLSSAEIYAKYGPEALTGLGRGATQLMRDEFQRAGRQPDEALYDSMTGLAAGAVGSLGGLAALGVGLVDDEAGAKFGNAVQEGMQWVEGTQSDGVNAARRIQRTKTALDIRDNDKLFQEDLASGDTSLAAGMRRWGRDLVDTLANSVTDPTMLLQGTAEATGSLLAGGPVAKGLRALGAPVANAMRASGPLTKNADRLVRAGQGAAWPLATAGLEAGGVYSGSTSEVMDMSYEELAKNSPLFRELVVQNVSQGMPEADAQRNAKFEVANRTGLLAAAIQAPIAAAAGHFTRFAENPTRVTSLGSGLSNVLLREPGEEAFQSLTGGMTQNYAIQQNADSTQQISEGLGEQTAQGALYGMTSAGAVQGPGMAGQAAASAVGPTLRATGAAAKLGYFGMRNAVGPVVEAGKPLFNAILERGAEIRRNMEKASPVSDEAVAERATNAANSVSTDMGEVVQAVRSSDATPEEKSKSEEYIDLITKAMIVMPTDDDVRSLDPDLRHVVSDTISRPEAIQRLSRHISSLTDDSELLRAASALYQLMGPYKQLEERDDSLLDRLMDQDPRIGEMVEQYQVVLRDIVDTPSVTRAMRMLNERVSQDTVNANIKPVSEADLNTVEGRQNIENAVAVADMFPDRGNLEANEQILTHARNGRLNLSPTQLKSLEASTSLLRARRKMEETIAQSGLSKVRDVVSSQIVAGNDPLRKTVGKMSAAQHTKEVLRGAQSGNTEKAAASLWDFGLFVQHMQNKVEAVNKSLAQNGIRVAYEQLQPTPERDFKLTSQEGGVWVNTRSPVSVEQAQAVALEASILSDIYNGLVETFPELSQARIESVALDPSLIGKPDEVVQRFRNPASVQKAKPSEPAATPTEDESAPAEAAPTPEVVEQAPEDETASTEKKLTLEERAARNRERNAEIKAERQAAREEAARQEALDEAARDEAMAEQYAQQQEDTPEVTQEQPIQEETLSDELGEDIDTVVEAPATLAETYPNLAGEGNQFLRAFRMPKEMKSRLLGMANPAETLRRVLSSNMRLTAFLSGSTPRNTLTQETAQFYRDYLSLEPDGISLGSLLAHVTDNLESFLDKPRSKSDKTTVRELFASGTPVHRWKNGKTLNIVDNVNGQMQYNTALLEQAALATLQWFLQADQYSSHMDEMDVASLLGLPMYGQDGETAHIDEATLNRLSRGMSSEQMIRSLGQKISRYWGLDSVSNTDDAYVEGIPQSIAAEMVRGLQAMGLIEIETTRVGDRGVTYTEQDSDGKVIEHTLIQGEFDPKLIQRYVPVPIENEDTLTAIKDFPDAIDVAALVEPDFVNYFGDIRPEVPQTQLNNPEVQNTAGQKDAIEKEQKTPFFVDNMMVNFFTSMGANNLLRLFGTVVIDEDDWNKNDLQSIKGRNQSITEAFKQMTSTVAQLSNYARKEGISLTDAALYYGYNMSRAGRMQMLGRYSPQASKLMREAILASRSVLDLSNQTGEHWAAYMLAMGQALGIKVHNMEPEEAQVELDKMLRGPLNDAVTLIHGWMDRTNFENPLDNNSSFSNQEVEELARLFKLAGADMTMHALHAVVDYARLVRTEDRSNFVTSLYVEADGVTNGPINAMALMTAGSFNERWIRNIRKGGLSIGQPRTLANIRKQDPDDLYQAATTATREALSALRKNIPASFRRQMDHVLTMMDLFSPDLSFDPDKAWDEGGLVMKRGIAKNPLTVFIYGSGANGIAGKLVTNVVGELYSRMSAAIKAEKLNKNITPAEAMFPNDPDADAKFKRFQESFTALTTMMFEKEFGELTLNYVDSGRKDIDPRTFTLNKTEMQAFQSNMLEMFVRPMQQGISNTVGSGLIKVVGLLRDITQVQSVIVEHDFQQGITKALADKEKNDKNWRKGDFLSRADRRKILDGLKDIMPLINSDDQSFLISSSESIDLVGADGRERPVVIGAALDDSMESGPSMRAPGRAGVRAIPLLTIGMGDGLMMQLLAQLGLEGTLKVFDGMNMPLDKIRQYSLQANEAVYESWKGNPARNVLATYERFLANYKPESINASTIDALAQALFSSEERREFRKAEVEITPEMVIDRMKVRRDNLEWVANSIDARHQALQSMGMSVDQMATAATPFHNGVVQDNMTDEEVLQELERRYEENLARLESGEPAPIRVVKSEVKTEIPKATAAPQIFAPVKALPPPQPSPEVEKVGRLHSSGIRVLSWTAMNKLANSMTQAQKLIFGEIRRSLAAKEYHVVAGTIEQLDAYIAEKGLSPRPRQELFGWTNINDKTIYMVNPTTETLVHELVHASTFETVLAHYNGNSTPEVKEAVARLEKMMQAFVSGHFDYQTPKSAIKVVKRPHTLRDALAGMLSREELKGQIHSDYFAEKTRSGRLLFPQKGGVGLDKLQEFLQLEGYLPEDPIDGQPIVDHNDVLDLIQQALNDEDVFSVKQGEEVAAYQDYQRALQEEAEQDSLRSATFDAFKNDPAYASALEAILSANLEPNDAVAQAKALNEFMAWALTNQKLTEGLAQTKVPSLVQLAKDAIQWIRQLFWGKKKMPKPAEDFLSNLQFNSGILMRSQPSLSQMLADTNLLHAPSYGTSARISRVRESFTKKIIEYVKADVPTRESKMRKTRVNDIQKGAADLALIANANGFPMTMQESVAFRMIVSALATEAEIDPNALARAQELYSHVTKNLMVESFMEDPESLDPAARYYAQQKFDMVMGKLITRTDDVGRSSLLSVFLGLATVSDDFRSVLAKIKLPAREKNKDRTLDAMLENVGNTVLDSLSRRLSGDKKSEDVLTAIDNLSRHIHKTAQDDQSFVEQNIAKAGGMVDSLNDYIVNGAEKLSDLAMEKADQVERDAKTAIARYSARWLKGMAAVVSEKNGQRVAEQTMSLLNQSNVWEPFHKLVSDLVGRTQSNALVYDMIKVVRSMVQQVRQQFREETPRIIMGKFKTKLTNEQWASMFRAYGRTDAALLRDTMSHAEIHELFSDVTKLDAEINSIEQQIQQADPAHWNLIQKKSRQLATFMNGGNPGANLLRNAASVSMLWDEKVQRGRKTLSGKTTAQIDKLITLYAIEMLSAADKAAMASLVPTDSEGLSFTLDYLVGQRKEEMSKATGKARYNAYKGYIPSEQEPGVNLRVAADTDFAKLRELGYVRVAPYTGSSTEPYRGSKSYYYAPVSGQAIFNQGIMQNVRHTAGGVDASTGMTVGPLAGRVTDRYTVRKLAAQMAKETNMAEALMPVRNEYGVVIAMERPMAPIEMERVKRSEHLPRMIGVWRGRQAEEGMSQRFNEQLIDNLKTTYDNDIKISSSKQKEYINLFGNSLTPVQRDAVELFTDETRGYIRQVFGDEFWVRKELFDDAVGYRSASVGDVFTGNTAWSKNTQDTIKDLLLGIFGPDAYRYMVRAEQIIQNFMADARTWIVIKSVVVPALNFSSNIYQLISRGVPIMSIVRGMPRKLGEIDSYAKSQLRKIDAEAELRATEDPITQRRLKTEIRAIEDGHRRLSIWPLIEAGEFSTIADVGMTSEDLELTSGKLGLYMEKMVDKLPESVKNAGRYALVTRDTALFQGLQKSVQYGDFVAKAILYDDLTKRKGRTQADALARITEEFVNYDRLPGRFRAYLENMGLLWFYNFKIRISKIAVSTIRNNPVHALIAAGLPTPDVFGSFDLPQEDSLFAKLWDGTMGYSIGPEMGLKAPFLNPWLNLVN